MGYDYRAVFIPLKEENKMNELKMHKGHHLEGITLSLLESVTKENYQRGLIVLQNRDGSEIEDITPFITIYSVGGIVIPNPANIKIPRLIFIHEDVIWDFYGARTAASTEVLFKYMVAKDVLLSPSTSEWPQMMAGSSPVTATRQGQSLEEYMFEIGAFKKLHKAYDEMSTSMKNA